MGQSSADAGFGKSISPREVDMFRWIFFLGLEVLGDLFACKPRLITYALVCIWKALETGDMIVGRVEHG